MNDDNFFDDLLAQLDAVMERCRRCDEQSAAIIANMRATIDQAEAEMARFDQLQG